MTVFESPIGPLMIEVNEDGAVVEIRFSPHPAQREDALAREGEVIEELRQYFDGKRREFTVPLAPRGTPFQLSVWRELERIPFGSTISYAELARRIGKPSAVRAAGAANGANPIPIIIPCHRVIGANGTLVGYGGGLHIKRTLLALEQPQRTLLETA